MKIVDQSLEKTLESLAATSPNEFPFDQVRQSYWDRYQQLANKLNTEFHPQVLAGSMAADGGMLTDHGPEHIQTVINRAAALLDDVENENALSGYEIYLLLCAIHFHDLGNIRGRVKHEKIISEMMSEVASFLGDATEKKYIREIAEVHGGKVADDKDTIAHLQERATLFSKEVRLQALAGILRFADELADDHFRANNILAKLNQIPDSSLIYHTYAQCLNSVVVRPNLKNVELHYHINIKDFVRTFPKHGSGSKGASQVYLLDEIFERLIKAYTESVYCNRFTTPFVDVRSISVEIMCLKDGETVSDKKDLPHIKFTLREKGYPAGSNPNIHSLTSELSNWEGEVGAELSGALMAEQLNARFFSEAADDA